MMHYNLLRWKLSSVTRGLFLVSFFGYVMTIWLTFRHNAQICIAKRNRVEVKALHTLLVNGSDSLAENITVSDIIHRLKDPTAARIKGDVVNKIITDYRYYLIEPLLNTSLIETNTLFVFVQSKGAHQAKRKRIRETWANRKIYAEYAYNPIYVIFAVGLTPSVFISNSTDSVLEAVIQEAYRCNDILLLNMMDIYDNLTIKGFLAMMWIASQGRPIKYVMKTDDDVLLNTFAWFRIVNRIRTNRIECVLVGCIWHEPPVYRYGKYVVSEAQYRYDRFPSFSSGSGYLMTRAAMVTILEAAFNLPFLTRDDPYFAGIIPRLTGIPLVSLPQSAYLLNEDVINSDKMEQTGVLVVHKPDSERWTHAWTLFLKHKRYGYPKTYRAVFLNSKNRASKYAVPVVLESSTDYKTSLPPEWRLSEEACLTLNCNKPFPKVRWQIQA